MPWCRMHTTAGRLRELPVQRLRNPFHWPGGFPAKAQVPDLSSVTVPRDSLSGRARAVHNLQCLRLRCAPKVGTGIETYSVRTVQYDITARGSPRR